MIRALSLVLLAWGTSASAQALTVRSGEHEGYTRLVVQVPSGTGWMLDPVENGARLSIGIDNATFNTASVFDRLSGNRLQSLQQAGPGAALEMTFGCDCVATAFLHRQTMVVIDIAPDQGTPASDPVEPEALPRTASIPAQKPLPTDIPATELALPLLQLNQRNFEEQLASRILQSADREVVDLELAGVGSRESSSFGPLRSSEKLVPNLRLSSVLDEVSGLGNLAVPQIDSKPECITDSELGFGTWSGARSFSEDVAELRVGLFQEFDRVDQAYAMDLAKLYTYFGFGVEAHQALSLLSETSVEQRRLAAIASVMDGLPAPTPNPLAGQQRCDGAAALWALLSEGKLQSDAHVKAIERSFGRLPWHLRQHLGPDIAEMFVSAGRLEASRRILRAVERILEDEPADVTFAQAKIADAAGDTDTAETLLTEVISAPDAATDAPLALARLIEKRWSDRGTVSPRDLDLAASYARELRKSELGPMLARAHALAMALSQDFTGALAGFEDVSDSDEWQRTRDQVFQLLAERADDITFLRHVMELKDRRRNALAVETAVSMAERLADLGFSAQAYALANRPQDRERSRDRARLRAKAALMDNRPCQALLEIADDSSDTAQELRAQAMMQTQDFDAVARALQAGGKHEMADRYNWLAGSGGADEERSNTFTDLSRIRTSLIKPVARQPDKPLSDAAMLIQDSTIARAQITEMLETVRAIDPN